MASEDECCNTPQEQKPLGFVGLPLSIDGKTWTGRESCFWTDDPDEEYHRFDGLVYHNGKWYVKDIDQTIYAAESVWYERPDSFEKLEKDLARVIEYNGKFMTWTCAYQNQSGDTCESCKFFNSKCGKNEMLKDVVSRIHKLAAKKGR